MSEFRKNLLNRMIAIYGENHPIVKDFIAFVNEYVENDWNNKCLDTLVQAHEWYIQHEEA